MENDEVPQLSLEMARLSNAFPFGTEGNVDKAMDLLYSHLPSQPRAWSLCETYMEHAAWVFRPLKRDEIIDDVLSPIYKAQKERQASGSIPTHNISSHRLAILFLVFALGALVDLTLEPCESSCLYDFAFTFMNTSESPARQCGVRDFLSFESCMPISTLNFRLSRNSNCTGGRTYGSISRNGRQEIHDGQLRES